MIDTFVRYGKHQQKIGKASLFLWWYGSDSTLSFIFETAYGTKK